MNDMRINSSRLPAGQERRRVSLVHTIERDGFALDAFEDPTDHGNLLASGLCLAGRQPTVGSKLKAADGREAVVHEVQTETDPRFDQFLNLYAAARLVAKGPVMAAPPTTLDRLLDLLKDADPKECKEIGAKLEAIVEDYEARRRWRWCEHIKRGAGEWDFGVWAGDLAGWTVCPICGAKRPEAV